MARSWGGLAIRAGTSANFNSKFQVSRIFRKDSPPPWRELSRKLEAKRDIGFFRMLFGR